ncbi:type II toxin-antitoxin system VapC family toxin [Mesorhizobium xinjiangense]|uniref:type II toxin-antitoxin system VapC family toxin n=1 Tax=Mesorhizobium xinjiangense TaxID=2678685 RepID=UPI0012EDD880|nr:type II toxin-antitoxin system VapC family toxin [Mesorhizobium xinjiangense]
MIVLDTNIVSEPMAKQPAAQVLAWLDRQSPASLYLTAPGIAEMYAGAREFVRRTGSQRYLAPLERIVEAYSERILDFGRRDAVLFGQVVERRNAIGRPILTMDTMIAAICLRHDATLATRNIRDFEGLDLKLVNPFEADV